MHTPDLATLTLNGQPVGLPPDPSERLSSFLRTGLGLTGTKIGCGEGECGSCSVIIDGEPAYACLVPVGQVRGSTVVTIEGLARETRAGHALANAFLARQAVQCGFCTPGFLVAAAALLDRCPDPSPEDLEEALTGVLCRCTGYAKILAAVQDVIASVRGCPSMRPAPGQAVGTAVTRLDGPQKVDGSQHFGADGIPADALLARAIRSPHHHAAFEFGALDAFRLAHPGVVAILSAPDIPGRNLHGVAGAYADQPVFATGEVRFRGEAVALVVGEGEVVEALDLERFPVTWRPLTPQLEIGDSLTSEADVLHAERPSNILIRGHVERGDVDAALAAAAHVVEGRFSTQFVEHAYLEPEAGWARREGNRIAVHSCTQAPHAHRADLAKILDIPDEDVWVVPTAVGGGFGGKLDLTTQPYVAVAAWLLDRPVGMIYSRAESIATSTKRHPGQMISRIAADASGRITAVDFRGDFNTGAYASWGTAVANRVPVDASGPYYVPHYRAMTRAVHTHVTAAGAFRGFGVPQTAFAQEQLIDALAAKLGMDPLEFRLLNALQPGQPIPTGQSLADSVGITKCLEALRPRWTEARAEAEAWNTRSRRRRRGAGIAAMFYGCGNTAMANPSTMRIGIRPNGDVVLHQGAVDAGQGSNTVIPQIGADALGIALDRLVIVGADTNLTPDCGRTSASRQTFVTGKAAEMAGKELRRKIIALSNAGPDAHIAFGEGQLTITQGDVLRTIDLASLPVDAFGYVLRAEETFDPPTTSLGPMGQGTPYAVYAFGAQLAEVEVDVELGVVRVTRFTAAHDVGRIVNPTLLQGQIEGAIAQGIGMALLEEFVPGRSENFHEYLIPTLRDVPPIETIFVEENASIGPFGAKGIGEPSLVPTAAAIMNAINHAIGKPIPRLPATPDVVLAAMADEDAA